MDKQAAYDAVVFHLLAQGVASTGISGESCAYRGYEDGTSCAVGCLIPDKEYSESLEGDTVDGIQSKVPSLRGLDIVLLIDLQAVHDVYDPTEWPSVLRTTGEAHGLDTSILNYIEEGTHV